MEKTLRLNFAHLPTPIEELPNLSNALNGPRILVKRDDQTGLAFGGNKTRKLEFLIAEAQEQGADTLISGGALQSNHCRQTAAAAARYGFECKLVLTGKNPNAPPPTFCSINSLARKSPPSKTAPSATKFCKKPSTTRLRRERNRI